MDSQERREIRKSLRISIEEAIAKVEEETGHDTSPLPEFYDVVIEVLTKLAADYREDSTKEDDY